MEKEKNNMPTIVTTWVLVPSTWQPDPEEETPKKKKHQKSNLKVYSKTWLKK